MWIDDAVASLVKYADKRVGHRRGAPYLIMLIGAGIGVASYFTALHFAGKQPPIALLALVLLMLGGGLVASLGLILWGKRHLTPIIARNLKRTYEQDYPSRDASHGGIDAE